ncbi:MAG: hypothetical protein JNM52_05145 [Betaproteobacteria bacterium]|nr:hypothetical protein [Betaproteobacteria bacterium]
MQIIIHQNERLYGLSHSAGYSFLGFDHCYQETCELVRRLNAHLPAAMRRNKKRYAEPDAAKIGTHDAYTYYQNLVKHYADNAAANRQTWLEPGTDPKVGRILEGLRLKRHIVRLFLGDPQTGRDWCEENDVVGFIGRTGGPLKTLILLEPVNDDGHIRPSLGGGTILTARVLRIIDVSINREVYRFPGYQLPCLTTSQITQGCYRYAVFRDGLLHARFKNEEEAWHYMAFLSGVRSVNHPYRRQQEIEAESV